MKIILASFSLLGVLLVTGASQASGSSIIQDECGGAPLPPCSQFWWLDDALNPVEGEIGGGLLEGPLSGELNREAANDLCGSGQWQNCGVNSANEETATNARPGQCVGVGEIALGGMFGSGTVEGCGSLQGGDKYSSYFARVGFNRWVQIW